MKKKSLGELVMDAAVLLVFLACMAFVYIGFKIWKMPDFVFHGIPVFFTFFESMCFLCVITWIAKIFSYSNWWRKKVKLFLIPFTLMSLTACSAFDSDPIEPNIIGIGNLQYEGKSGTWFVVVDSTQYTVATVTILDRNPRSYGKTQNVEPVEGMLVTVFTSPRMNGIQAVTGRQSIEQIEELYHTDETVVVVVFGLLLLCVLGIALIPNTKKVPVVNADV